MPNPTVREARENDLDVLLGLYTPHLHAEDEPLPPREQVERIWREMLDRPGLHVLIAESDAAPAASCTLAVIPNLTRGARPLGIIENVVTHAAYRRRGLGQAVMRRAMDIAWDAGCYKIMLLTARRDPAVHAFYRQLGFDGTERTGYVAYRR